MKKTRWFLTAAAVLCSGMGILMNSDTVLAESTLNLESCYIWDEADVLTDAQETELDALIADTAETIQMNVFVRLGANELESSEDARAYAIEDYTELFGSEQDSDGVALYLDLYGTYIGSTDYAPHDYLVTHGLAQLYYTNDEDGSDRVSAIFDQMNPHMQRGQEDPYTAVTIFCEELVSYYQQGIPEDYYVYDDEYEQYLYLDETTEQPVWSEDAPPFVQESELAGAFTMSFLFGLIVALIALLVIRHHYRFRSQPSAQIYIPNGTVQYQKQKDRFLRKHISRTKIHTESDHHHDFDFGGGSSSDGFGGGGNDR